MVESVAYPINKFLPTMPKERERSFLSKWRSSKILSSELEHKINQRVNTTIGVETGLKGENMKMLKTKSSMNVNKSTNHGVSANWGEIFRYHWPMAFQSFAVVLIILFGPLIGTFLQLRLNDDELIKNLKIYHPSSHLSPVITDSPKSPSITSSQDCPFGYFCMNKKKENGEPVRRRASFLRRKRYQAHHH